MLGRLYETGGADVPWKPKQAEHWYSKATVALEKIRALAESGDVFAQRVLGWMLAKGKGAIVFSCHMGPYALIPAILSTLFYKVTAVDKLSYLVRPTALAKVEKSNAAYGEDRLETLPVGDGLLLRKLERRLHEGRVVFMMGDYRGTPARGAEPIRFLGHPVHAGRGLAWLHARTGAPLIPAIFTFEKGKPRLEVGEEVNVEGLRTPRDITQRIYKTLEQRILKSPERWALWIDYHLMVSHETLNAEKENNPQ
ncbi:MAG: hypothetical protein QGH59_06405 [Gemmatimonadota bacterium]|nr:hypothetical protein [Gemmatimonadota bacterium]